MALLLPVAAAAQNASIGTSGAACNGTSDDTGAINRYLATLKSGATVTIPAGSMCLINSGNLVVPTGVRIIGASYPFNSLISLTGASGFILNPSYTIMPGSATLLQSLFIRRSSMVPNPTASQVLSAVSAWAAEDSVAVTLSANDTGQVVRDVAIEGFHTAVKSFTGRFTLENLWGDDFNGVDVTSAGDNHYIIGVRFEPFYALSTLASSGSWARPGIAFYLHDGNTGSLLSHDFSFMFANGVVLSGVGVTQIRDSGFEWQGSIGHGITGTDGIRWINHDAETSVTGTYVNSFDTAFSVETTGGEVIMTSDTAAGGSATGFNLEGTTNRPVTLTYGGKPAAGDTVSATFSSAGIIGSPLTITYKLASGDTTRMAAEKLATLINSNQALIAARVFAGTSANVLSIYSYPKLAAIVTGAAGSDGITVRSGLGTAGPGSYGLIANANLEASSAAHSFVIGANALRWIISAPNQTIGNSLPAHWLQVDPTAANKLTLSGIQWSHAGGGNLSRCGISAGINASATDSLGTITEGAGASGCTLTFATPFAYTPQCILSSPTGSTWTRFSATSTALTIVNARATGDRFTYLCQ